jgi:hypothetical protein
MLQFFADSTNFTRRLTDVRANAKFSSPYATPEDVSSGRREDLKSVVENLRKRYGVQYVYCWHGLSAYWSGVSPTAPAMAKYEPSLHFPKPTPGLSEIEPRWGPHCRDVANPNPGPVFSQPLTPAVPADPAPPTPSPSQSTLTRSCLQHGLEPRHPGRHFGGSARGRPLQRHACLPG